MVLPSKGETSMLHITGSCKALKEELRIANNLCNDIIGVIKKVDSNTNFKKEFGIFVVQMPEFKIISKDAEAAKQLLRKICTGELQPHELFVKITSAQKEIHVLLDALSHIS